MQNILLKTAIGLGFGTWIDYGWEDLVKRVNSSGMELLIQLGEENK
ncbi:hypothetical protein [Algoriphagus taiwanensis]|uniref:Uncharacterized protein n=1 Tax=Algoriphagus taiwanensis TaxID=1445656 RepID=A0ABQ6Q644_9BACT|nr:hypothetical protein Ataiwa_36550 [Algoriphagus taiwanensis]